jgi:hypothetical protein
MAKIVIWEGLNAQSVCTYQIWISLILWCSASSKESRDYKFEIFGLLVQKKWIKQTNRRFSPNLKLVSNRTHEIWDFIELLNSTGFKDSNGITFAIFGPTDQKIQILQGSDQIWFEIPIRISVWTRGRHAAWSDWPVPFRSDRRCGSLDLKWIERTRSTDTSSFKWSDLGFWILIGRTIRIREERSSPRVFCASPAVSLRTGGWRRWLWGGFWRRWRRGRGSERRGELESVNLHLDCFQMKE